MTQRPRASKRRQSEVASTRSRLEEVQKQAALALEGIDDERSGVHTLTALASARQALDELEADTHEVES